jgi:shikimate kinase
MQLAPIFLLGFMCSGKTRVGRELARLAGLRHIDIDRRIEERVGPLQPFFAEQGEAAFRELEREVLREVIQERDVVISTGGGTPLNTANMDPMLAFGTTVFLDVPFRTLLARIIRSGGDRPLLMGLKGEALEERVKTLLEERQPIYSRAHVIIEADGTPEGVAKKIAESLKLDQTR